jgi:SAM-dependent methyltransferase
MSIERPSQRIAYTRSTGELIADILSPLPASEPLRLSARDFHALLQQQGPSLGLWRAAEVALLRQQLVQRPVLDLGCGDGLVTSFVLRHAEIGLDPDWEALNQAGARGIYQRLIAAPVAQSGLPDGSIGTVLSNSVLEHVERLDEALHAVGRLLRPGGQLIFTVPSEAFSRWLALPSARYAAWRNRRLQHLNLWTMERWARQLAHAHLEVEQVRPYLRRRLVMIWDMLELLQQIRIGRKRLFGMAWRRLPPKLIRRMARFAARLDLSAPAPGGGRLIVARKR